CTSFHYVLLRIWIVNLLLIVVTATLYWPFARARRLAYFQANTVIDGQPLGFHGDPWKMFRGYLMMLALAIVYSVASNVSPLAAMVSVAVLALVWPALWRASLQFRLANTSWRGVRFAFKGSLGGAYGAMLPAFLPSVVLVGLGSFLGAPGEEATLTEAQSERLAYWMGLSMLAFMLALPWALARIKLYQHQHYHYAGQTTQLTAGTGQFYVLALKVLGVALLLGVVAVALLAVVALVGGGLAAITGIFGGEGGGRASGALVAMTGLLMLGIYITSFFVIGPYAVSRMQNLVWGHTHSADIRFGSDLRLLPLARRTALNLFLTAITLGLYRPFAVVAMTRLKLEAMSITVTGSVDEWVAESQQMNDAAGDAAGDFFGIDMGL
ncbi:MAG: YjgN family protein, partial [Ideonella sp.]|nr:YjgN family protein [Ideonella sp.]